jgi:hypothetical protein
MPTQPVERTDWPPQLVSDIHDEYMVGNKSLRVLGRKYGVSHERIRQLFERDGLPTRRPRTVKERSKAWNSRKQIWTLYEKHGTVEAVAKRIKFPRADIAKVIEAMPLRQIYRRKGETAWELPNAEILAALREAAKVCGEPLTIPAYREQAPKHGWPADLTVVRPYGTWQAACEAAGVKANESEGPRRGAITLEDCIEALRDCASELGATPSYETYSKWAKKNHRPSGPTVRVKVRQHQNGSAPRGAWSEALTLAFG